MVQRRNSGSPSFHSFDALSMERGVEATRNFATAAPEGVNRSLGVIGQIADDRDDLVLAEPSQSRELPTVDLARPGG